VYVNVYIHNCTKVTVKFHLHLDLHVSYNCTLMLFILQVSVLEVTKDVETNTNNIKMN
jgi:hypothetical protein